MANLRKIFMNYSVLVSVFAVVCKCAPPVIGDDLPDDELEEDSSFQGEIVTDSEIIPLQDIVSNGQRNIVADPRRLWPDKTLYYELDVSLSDPLRARVHTALNQLARHSCVRFQPRRPGRPYLRVRTDGKGCSTRVGYQGGGAQSVQVASRNCQTLGTIQHEFLHALGFWHEHARPDRDDFVTVIWQNIRPDRKRDFIKMTSKDASDLGLPYDYASVMHYRHTSFAKPRGSPTLVPKKKEMALIMGQRRGVSNVDIAKLNRLYDCSWEYYRGDDLDGLKEIVGEVIDSKEEIQDHNGLERSKYRQEKKMGHEKLLKKGGKSVSENSEFGKFLTYNEFSRSSPLPLNEDQISAESDIKNIYRARRQTDDKKSREGKSMPMGDSQGHQENFTPQKILPELLKGVLNNDNNERPIVIQFAIYQPIVYKNANETENEESMNKQNNGKGTNQDKSQDPRSTNEEKSLSEINDGEVHKENIDIRRPDIEDSHHEENSRTSSREYDTREKYDPIQDEVHLSRPSIDHDERFPASSKDIQPLNVYRRKGEDERTNNRPYESSDDNNDRFRNQQKEHNSYYEESGTRYDHNKEDTFTPSNHGIKDGFEETKEPHPTYKPYIHEIGIEDTRSDSRDYLKISTADVEEEHHIPLKSSIDEILHNPDNHKSDSFSITHKDEREVPKLKNEFKIENVSPYWNSQMSEEDNIKLLKKPEVHEAPLGLSRDREDDGKPRRGRDRDREAIDRPFDNRPKSRPDLVIHEEPLHELDKEVRRKKLEQETVKEVTTKRPEKLFVPDSARVPPRPKDIEIDQRRPEIVSKPIIPKRKPPTRDSSEDHLEVLGSDPDLTISKPKVNLNTKQALPLNASALKVGNPTSRTVIRREKSTFSRE